MTKRSAMTTATALIGLMMMGAKGCEIWAETDAPSYTAGQVGTTTLHNGESVTAYLPGCATFDIEKWVNGVFENQGPNVVCFWEGIVRPLAAGASIDTPLMVPETGTYRLRYGVAWGCKEGVPMSQAGCSRFDTVYTNEFEVLPSAATCDHYGKSYKPGDSFTAFDGCNSCTCEIDGQISCTLAECECTGEEWNRDYRGDAETCKGLRIQCAPRLFPFSNTCGCGCQQAPWCERSYDCEPPTDCTFEQTHCPFSTFAF